MSSMTTNWRDMKTIGLFLFVSIAFVPAVWAETVHLKDGQEITGAVLEKSDKSIKVNVGGVPMTYYADEVKDIDGKPFAASAAAPKEAPVQMLGEPQQAPAADAELSGSKRDLILKFIDVFGTRQAMTQNLDAMLKTLPADNPEAQKLKDNIKVDEIIDRLIPIYDKQFTEDDLKTYIKFYSSPEGRKLVQGIGMIMRESVEVSAQYFQEKFPELKQQNNKS